MRIQLDFDGSPKELDETGGIAVIAAKEFYRFDTDRVEPVTDSPDQLPYVERLIGLEECFKRLSQELAETTSVRLKLLKAYDELRKRIEPLESAAAEEKQLIEKLADETEASAAAEKLDGLTLPRTAFAEPKSIPVL